MAYARFVCRTLIGIGIAFSCIVILSGLGAGNGCFGSADSFGQELLPNSSFEAAADGAPAGWRTRIWRGEAKFEYATVGRTGNRSVAISSEKGGDASWFVEVPVEPFATYRLSGWIKTEGLKPTTGRGVLLNIHNLQPTATSVVVGDSDWTRVEVVFETNDQDSLHINCLFGGWGFAVGKAWFDDLRLELLSKKPLEPVIRVDANDRAQPISPYIYGQFIEHLGRCIYGGIWAEMLEDRKFFYPVGAKESPWEMLSPGGVRMAKESPFVGEHTPLVSAGSGLRQKGLGVRTGVKCVGRIWLRSKSEPANVEVSLIWGDGETERGLVTLGPIPNNYQKYSLEFLPGKTTEEAILEIRVNGGDCYVGTLSLMPADNIEGLRADTLALLKELDAPVYRWPGGNFVSGYDWRKAIGDPDHRPPMKNPAWQGLEHHDFGIDEFIKFCRILNTEPLVVVNSGLGDLQMALEELEYCNGSAETRMGSLRAKNGHPEPYRVKYWGVGNEMYGSWQLGHMPLEQYIKKHNQFAEGMRALDPSIELIAVGEVGRWSEGMMQYCADHMDYISEHFYVGERPGLLSHVMQMPQRVRAIAEAHREYRKRFASLQGKDIRIALDEWNYWYGPHVYGELGTQYFLKDALGVAAALNEFARNTDMYFMGCYAQTVNVIGAIKTSKIAATMDTTGVVLTLYRKQFGQIPVQTETGGPIDAMAAWDEGRNALTLAVVNPTLRQLEVPLEIRGIKLSGSAQVFQISGDNPRACNRPGQEPEVSVVEKAFDRVGDRLVLEPCSVTLLVMPTTQGE